MTTQTVKLDGRLRIWTGTDETAEPYIELDLGGRMAPPEGQYWAVERFRMVVNNTSDTRILNAPQMENCRLLVVRNLSQAMVELWWTTRAYNWTGDPPLNWDSPACILRLHPGFPAVVPAIGDTTSAVYCAVLGAESAEIDVAMVGSRFMQFDGDGRPVP